MSILTYSKEAPVRNEAYRRLVASLPCWLCGTHGRSQAAHADQGKGVAMKSDDRTCYPLCCTQLGMPGCHDLVGASGRWTKAERREMEVHAARETQIRLIAAGLSDAKVRQVLIDMELWP